MKNAQQVKAARFRALHEGPDVLVLPNAWDVASAVVMEDAGFPAVGTTSAGMAALYGYPDTEGMTGDEMVALVGRMASALEVPEISEQRKDQIMPGS